MNDIEGLNAILKLFNTWYNTQEVQAICLLSLCCLGAWVVLRWVIKLIKLILWLWPVFLVVATLTMMPSLKESLTEEIIPKQVDEIMHIFDNKTFGNRNYNNDSSFWFAA